MLRQDIRSRRTAIPHASFSSEGTFREVRSCRRTFDGWHAIHPCACPGGNPLKLQLAADPPPSHRRGPAAQNELKAKGAPNHRSGGLSSSAILHRPCASAAARMASAAEENSATLAEKRVSFKNAKGEQIVGILVDTDSKVNPGYSQGHVCTSCCHCCL